MKRYEDFPFKLRACVWEITLACPFRCRYCGSGGGKARENELTTAECIDIAAQLSALGCQRVSLIGGEVFLREDWETIVTSLTGRGIRVCIITNGYRMTPDILAALRRVGVESVAVSIDGPQTVHDAFRQAGSFDRAISAVRDLTEDGIPTSVITTLRADNAPALPQLSEILRQYPIFAWQLQACSPMGNARGVDVRFDVQAVLAFIRDIRERVPFAVGAADNIGYYTDDELFLRGRDGVCFTGCSAGLTAVGIDSVGNVRGCESMYDARFNEGNLRKRSLMDIWTDPDAFAYNRQFDPSMLTGKCKTCPHGDVCAGGCRSYNWFSAGKLYENPLCIRGSE